MHKVWIIAAREFKINIKRWSFWLLTLGLPVLMFLIGVLSIAIILFTSGSGDSEEEKTRLPPRLGVVDQAAMLDWEGLNKPDDENAQPKNSALDEFALSEGLKQRLSSFINSKRKRGLTYEAFPDSESGEQALRDRKIRALLVLPPDFNQTFQARLLLYDEDEDNRVSLRPTERILRDHILAAHMPRRQIDHILNPLQDVQTEYMNQKPKKEDKTDPITDVAETMKKFVLPLIFMIMMMIIILTSTDRLLRGLVEEKANRVIELLLSSTTADQLMAGKVIGLGLIGMTQLTIWMAIGVIPFSFALAFISIDWITVLLFIVFFISGYFLLATLTLGLGSLGNNLQEAGQWTAIIVLITVLPSMFLVKLIENSDGPLAHFLTYFPPTCPLVVLFRHGAGTISAGEIVLSLIVMAISIFLAVKVGAKVFRVGILMTGKTPNPIQVWRALKNA